MPAAGDETFDVGPLRVAVDERIAREEAHQRAIRIGGKNAIVKRRVADIAIALVAFAGVGILAAIAAILIAAIFSEENNWPPYAPLLVGGATALPLLIAQVRGALTEPHELYQKLARAERFAQANHFTFTDIDTSPDLPGSRSRLGSNRMITGQYSRTGDEPLQVGAYSYDTFVNRARISHTFTFVDLDLGIPLPRVILDAVANGPRELGDERTLRWLSLEGDADQTFRLLCEPGAERDALYLFSPDILALFIDHWENWDAELVDGHLQLWNRTEMDPNEPAFWRQLGRFLTAFEAKSGQWERWRTDPASRRAARQQPVTSRRWEGGGTTTGRVELPAEKQARETGQRQRDAAKRGFPVGCLLPLAILIVGSLFLAAA